MAAATDRARRYLEQSLDDLNEFERKGLFTRAEVVNIARRRSDFEHVLNARGSKPHDYHRYVEFEANFDALCRRRARRLGFRTDSKLGSRRILSILDRGVRKFPAEIALWSQYMHYARRFKAHRKATEILISMVRLHPQKPLVWIYAAHFAFQEQGDMTEARSFMQRGLRFCKQSEELWLAYARIELEYIQKLEARRQILGSNESTRENAEDPISHDNGMILLDPFEPDVSTETEVGEHTPDRLAPVLSGAIPIAIFDAALREKPNLSFAHRFYEMAFEICRAPGATSFLDHVLRYMQGIDSSSFLTVDAEVRKPLIGIDPSTPQFAGALRTSLKRLDAALRPQPDVDLLDKSLTWITGLKSSSHDDDLTAALALVSDRCQTLYASATETQWQPRPNASLHFLPDASAEPL